MKAKAILHNEEGQAFVEMLIVMPLVLLLTGAIIGLGWLLWTHLGQMAYAQEAAAYAGKAGDTAFGQAVASRFERVSNVDFGRETTLFFLPPARGVWARAGYEGPALLLPSGFEREIKAGAFFRREDFYGGPPQGPFE